MATMFSAEGKYRKRYREHFNKLRSNPHEQEIPLSNLASRAECASIPLSDDQVDAIRTQSVKQNFVNLDQFQQLMTSKKAQSSSVKRLMYDIADPIITESQKVEIHSYIDAYNCCPPPIFMFLITLIEIGVFLYYYETDGDGSIWTDCSGCFVHHNHTLPGPLLFVPKLRGEAWRFASYMFLHSGLSHLISNVIVQLLVGIPLEVAHKIWRIGPLYLFAVIAGSLTQYAIDPNTMLVGASAGVYALITAHVANVILNWHEMPYRWVRASVLAVFLVFDFGGAIYRRYYINECDSISHLAHIAGAITGLVFGYSVLYNVVEHQWEKILRCVALGLYIAFLLVTIAMVIYRQPHSASLWEDATCK